MIRTLTLLLGLACVAPANAAPLSYADAVARAAARVDVAARQRGLDAHRALARNLSGQTGHPSVVIYPGWRLAPSDIVRPEFQAQLTHEWNVTGLSDARREALQAEAELLQAALADAAMGARMAASRAWIDRWAAEARLGAEQAALDQAARFAALVDQALEAGAITRDAAAEARAEVAQARLRVVDAEGQVVDAGHALARAVGEPTGQPLAVAGELPRPALPDPAASEGLVARARELPGPRLGRLAHLAAQARAVEIKAAAGSRLQAGVMLQVDDGVVAFGTLGVTWAAFDQGERDRAGARAEAEAARGAAEQAALEGVHRLAQALHEVEHARENEQALDDGLLPALRALVEARDAAFAAGQVTVFDVLRARARLAAAQRDRVAARAARAWAETAAWILLAAAGDAP
ncbi:MAG: TolC family protein [Myxococcales bacterium]|nr:TolC family protein [Myxococcales bacterium]